MNKKLKTALLAGFEAPAPARKKAFLRSIPQPPIRLLSFVCTQAGYIRKWVWVVSALIFAAGILGADYLEADILWGICACMPLLALGVLTESGRSERYGMAEFELSTRFSLKSVVLARLGILGAADFSLFCLLVPFAGRNNGAGILQTGVYMACPYLLTTFGGLWAVRRVRGRESAYLCAGIAAAVSTGSLWISQAFPAAYARQSFLWWVAAFLIFGFGTTRECVQMVKQTEELAWN